jgi:hypothetical protein
MLHHRHATVGGAKVYAQYLAHDPLPFVMQPLSQAASILYPSFVATAIASTMPIAGK